MSQATSRSRPDAPATVLRKPHISYYDDHVTIRVPTGQWNEALQDSARSVNIAHDPIAVAELIASERSQSTVNRDAATVSRPVLHSDPRDAIPLTYCDKTRRIIALVGFVVSSATILGVHLASVTDRVPGFQPLTLSGLGPVNEYRSPAENRSYDLLWIGMIYGGLIYVVVLSAVYSCYCLYS